MMKDFIIFEVKKNRYAIDLEFIQRITQIPMITDIPNSHEYIDGMISYEKRIIKIIDFRKMTYQKTYDSELKELFMDLKEHHKEWIEALYDSIVNGSEFHLSTNPHHCDLGKWLDGFSSCDEHISHILKELNNFHKQLHQSAISILSMAKKDLDEAMQSYKTTVMIIYEAMMHHLDQFIAEFDIVANSLQKLLLYQSENSVFALKVDEIIDISNIQTSDFKNLSDNHHVSDFLELEGVIEINNTLVNVIKSIKLPSMEAV